MHFSIFASLPASIRHKLKKNHVILFKKILYLATKEIFIHLWLYFSRKFKSTYMYYTMLVDFNGMRLLPANKRFK